MEPLDLLGIASRWVHIVSAITVLGSVIFARCGLGEQFGLFASFRKALVYALVGLVASGLYNFFAKASTPPPYHLAFGIKVLLALHVGAVVLVAKNKRQLTGVMASGFVIVLISGYLRWLSR